MKNVSVLILEIVITVSITTFGLSGVKVLGMKGPRVAVIILGIVGMLLCTVSIGKFISSDPISLQSLIGYIFGTAALLSFITQLFKWNLPYISNPTVALLVLAVSILIKSVVARF